MKTTLTIACFTALLILGNLATAQTTALANPFADPNHEAPPPTTKARVENLKTRHAEHLATLTAALNRISGDPSLVSAKETFAAIDKADRDMARSKSASESILTAIRSEITAINADSAFAADQKAELETVAKTLAEECVTIRKEAELVAKNLAKSYKALAAAKKIYRSYLNLQGENQAREKLKAIVGAYVKSLTEAPAEVRPTEPTKDDPKSA
jgi:septal ring factor EnvC (AmiA/AmiB activator)